MVFNCSIPCHINSQVLKRKYLKRISDTVFDLFIWFWTNSFGCMHRLRLFVTLKSYMLATHTHTRTLIHSFIHSFTHAPTTTCRSSIKTTSSKWCGSASTPPEASIGFMVYVFESCNTLTCWPELRDLIWRTHHPQPFFISKQWRQGEGEERA